MDKIKEENKNLIALRNNYFAMTFIIGGGTAGLLFVKINVFLFIFLFMGGIYLLCVSVNEIRKKSTEIRKNLERMS